MTNPVWTTVSRPGPEESRVLAQAEPLRARHVLARTAWGDGVMLRLLEGGEGRPVVFVHGRGHAAATFAPVAAILARRCRTVAVDLPGFGHSAAPPFDPRRLAHPVDWFVAPVRSIVDQLGPDVVVVGHSLGGLVALEIALARPLAGLVLVDAMGLSPELGLVPRLYFRADPERLARTRKHLGLADHASDLGRMREELLAVRGGRPEASRAFEALVPMVGPIHHHASALARVGAPTLLVWGKDDRSFPLAVAEAALAHSPRARLVVLDAGHSPHVDQPDAVAAEIGAFLDGLDRDATTRA